MRLRCLQLLGRHRPVNAGSGAMNIPMHTRGDSTRGGRAGDDVAALRDKAPAAKKPPASRGVSRGGLGASVRAGRGAGVGAEATPAHRTTSAGWSELPSARLKNVKCADPFATKAEQFKTKFGSVFNSGGVPCRLYHGAANVSLKWSKDPCMLDFDPLLVICAEGLCETEHPYAFASVSPHLFAGHAHA